MIESVQPQGNKLSFAFSLSLAAGAGVRVCLVRPPHAPSLRRCPQLSTLVGDHRGRACVPEKWAVLPSAQIQPKLSLGRQAHGGSGGTFPFSAPWPRNSKCTANYAKALRTFGEALR